jgi:hypothetical protein
MVQEVKETLEVGGVDYPVSLLRKRETLGTVAVDHWWIDTRTLYGQRNRAQVNLRAVVDIFWALCRHHGTAAEPDVQEAYLLARLLPSTRTNGSRRVFNDARVSPPRGPRAGDKSRDAAGLELILKQASPDHLTFHEFREKTAGVLGPPRLTPDEAKLYKAFTADFLGAARAALQGDEAEGLRLAQARWDKAFQDWGRRRGFATEKRVLDVLSYEARAALHQCYSAVWVELLPRLAERHGLDALGRDFHRLWHLAQVLETDPAAPTRTHLFHGHVFALHPASGLLLRTAAGRDRVGAWLTAGADREAALHHLLYTLLLAVHHYAGIHAWVADDRRAMPPTFDPPPA